MAAFLLTRLMLALMLTPPEYSCTFFSKNGVVAAPFMPNLWASASARLIEAQIKAESSDSSAGTPISTPFCRFNCFLTASTSAISGSELRVKGDSNPEEGWKKPGKNLLPQVITGTPSVSKYSSVLGMSRMFLTPADTTATGVLPSSLRSALTSIVSSKPRCTPPSPPVTNTSMPASALQIIVPATVVDPSPFWASTNGMSLLLTFLALAPACASSSMSSPVSPMQTCPCMSATVAGTAPCLLTTSSTSSAQCLLCGQGMPCEMIVDSRATSGALRARAASTSGESRSISFESINYILFNQWYLLMIFWCSSRSVCAGTFTFRITRTSSPIGWKLLISSRRLPIQAVLVSQNWRLSCSMRRNSCRSLSRSLWMISQICSYSDELSTNYSRYSLIMSFSCCSSWPSRASPSRLLQNSYGGLLFLTELLRLMDTSSSRCCIWYTRSSRPILFSFCGWLSAFGAGCGCCSGVASGLRSLLYISSSSSSQNPSMSCCWKLLWGCVGWGAGVPLSLLLGLQSAAPSLISEMICRSEEILFLVAVLNQFSMMPSSLSLNLSSVSISFSCVLPTSFSFSSSSSHERCNSFNFLFSALSSSIQNNYNPPITQLTQTASRVYQYKMRYNSLRSQLNWHSRQQTHIFKKLNRNEDKERDSEKQEDLLKGNELIWLEKMMKELHQYKEETQEQDRPRKGKEPEQAEGIKEKSGRDGRGNADRHQKIVVNLDEPARSAKKIKFQIVINPDKPHSIKKIANSEPKSKPKSLKKPVSKTTPKKSLGEKMSAGRQSSASKEANSSKEIKVSCPSNTKVIDVESMKTDPYAFSETNLQVLEELWKKEEKACEPEAKLSSKKSVGKIIRNSDKLNKTCIEMPAKEAKPELNVSLNTASNSVQNTSYKQYKQSAAKPSASIHSFDSKEPSCELKEPPSVTLSQHQSKEIKQQSKILTNNQKTKYEKIYIKLQTDKLSEYLSQKSQVREENCSEKIRTNQYEKYCETKRNQKPTPHLSQSQKKSLTHQKKELEASAEKFKEESAPRAKSQQRKLNKFAQIVRPAKLSDFDAAKTKPAVKSIDQSIVFNSESKEKEGENRIEIKLKRKYDYKDEQLPSKAEKLFTLHSVASDYSSNQEFREVQPPAVVAEEPSRPSLSIELEEEISLPSQSLPSSATIPESAANSQQYLSESHFKESVILRDFDPARTDYTEELTLLFNFLDEGRRGLLTDTNCHSDLLTEQLKLLFSVILNQIRTKKRFYNLQKFIEESKEILQIKNEVYNSNSRSVQVKNMVYQILKENIDILRKKLPLMFVKFSYTQSCFQNSHAQSKKNSVTEGQSVVIDKVHFDHAAPKKEIEDCIFSDSFKDRSNDCARLEVPDKNAINQIRLIQKGRKDKENNEKYEVSYRKYAKRPDDSKSDLDTMQPEIYLQKKYGFGKGQEQECLSSQKMSTMFLKTRGYLQNLDSYLKMR